MRSPQLAWFRIRRTDSFRARSMPASAHESARSSFDKVASAMASEPSPAAEEPDLLERLRSGEEGAYEELVRRYGGRLLAVARRFLPVEEDARDAVQDAFLSAFRGLASFEGQAQLSTWLHRIVVNASLMKLRTRRRKPEQSI